MNIRYIIPFLLMGAAACSDHEGTGPKPVVYENQISQIDITSTDRSEVIAFRYNGALPYFIAQAISSSDQPIHYVTYDLIRHGAQAQIECRTGSTTDITTITLNDDGSARTISGKSENGSYQIDYSYTSGLMSHVESSYFQFRCEYEYRIIGERFNLEKITLYRPLSTNSSLKEQAVSTITFEYGTQKNDSSIDLGFILRSVEAQMSMEANLFGMGGKRSINLPSSMHYKSSGIEYIVYYTYQLNEGRVTQIEAKDSGSNQMSTKYKITYL